MNPLVGPLLGAIVDLPGSARRFKAPPAWLNDVLWIMGLSLGLLLVLAAGIYIRMKSERRRRRHISGGEKVYRDSQAGPADPASTHEPAPQSELDAELEDDEEFEHESEDDSEESEHHHDHHDHGHHHHGRRRYKYRVRRRSHRSRNPTLSETGGLPPVKPQAPTKPF